MILMNEELSTRKFFLCIFSTSETCVEISRATRAKGTLTSLRKTSSFCLRPIHKLLCLAFNKWLKAIFQKHTQFLFSFLLRCLYMKAGKDLTTSTSSSNSITSRILVQKLYSHLVMKFLLPNFRRKMQVFLSLDRCQGSQRKLTNIVLKEFTPEKHSKYCCWVHHCVPKTMN